MQTMFERAASVRRPAASPRSGVIGFLTAVVLLAATACSGTPGTAPPTATAMPTAPPRTPVSAATPFPVFQGTPAAFTAAQAEFGAIVWTASVDPATNAPRAPVSWFAEDAATIYAAVPTLRLDQGTIVTAAWTYNDTPVESLSSSITATAAYVDAWIEFHITRSPDTPWPTGVYQVAVSIGGADALVSEIEVRAASG